METLRYCSYDIVALKHKSLKHFLYSFGIVTSLVCAKEDKPDKIVFSKTQKPNAAKNVQVENGDLVTIVNTLKNSGKDIIV